MDIEDIVGRKIVNDRTDGHESLSRTDTGQVASSTVSSCERPLVVPKGGVKAADETRLLAASQNVPGSSTIYVKTYGCGHNQSDGEYMCGLLSEAGYRLTDQFDDPAIDAFLLNSCTVKNPSEQQFGTLMERARARNRPVIVAGCVPQGSPAKERWAGMSVVGVQQIHRVVHVVEQALQGNTVRLLARRKGHMPTLDLPKIRRNPLIEVIPINVGCLNQCTYCKTKHARGDLASWSIEEIVERVRSALADGVKEIRLTSEDTGAYGRDLGTNIVELLRSVVAELPDGVMLRLGMSNPPYMKEHVDELAELLDHPCVYSFLHIPVQAGSDRVLDQMRREYTVADFQYVVDRLLSRVPDMIIATDVICGFPGETEEEFDETMALVERNRFAVINISQFYARPGTPAAQMPRVLSQHIKARSRRLTRLFESFEPHNHLVGRRVRVWVSERAHDGTSLVGHTKNYVQVILSPDEASMGNDYAVEIVEAGRHYVRGKVLGSSTLLIGPRPSQVATLSSPRYNIRFILLSLIGVLIAFFFFRFSIKSFL